MHIAQTNNLRQNLLAQNTQCFVQFSTCMQYNGNLFHGYRAFANIAKPLIQWQYLLTHNAKSFFQFPSCLQYLWRYSAFRHRHGFHIANPLIYRQFLLAPNA